MKVTGIWQVGKKKDKLRVTHTLVVDAQNIEEAIEALKNKYPQWTLKSIRSTTK